MGPYDVFISHCGADCKRDFAVWLLTVLNTVGLCCFFDDRSLKAGGDGEKEMLEAMRTAKYGIVVLSAGFFEREWCMEELRIFASRGRILPVFFGTFAQVQQARAAGIASCVWKTFKRFVQTEDEYRQAAEVSTRHIGLKLESPDGFWDTLIFKIRNEVLGLLGKDNGGPPISEIKLFLGQKDHLVELKELLGVQRRSKASDPTVVGIVGVKGMGGIGKSTTAKKLYDDPDVRGNFPDGMCWLEVGEKPTDDKITILQKQIIDKICNLDAKIPNPTEGRALIRQKLSGRKVLIFLDDLWEDASIATPVVDIDHLGAGSRIFITSRNREAIDAKGAVHEMDVLSLPLAWKLFRWHAFGGDNPDVSIEDTAKQAAERCGGLPLALELVGKQVRFAAKKEVYLSAFLEVPQDDNAMINARIKIRASVDRLPDEPRGLRDVFVLIAGVWPNTPRFREHGRALENIGAAVYGQLPAWAREKKASKALEILRDLSLIGGGRGQLITAHDLIVDVAVGMTDVGEEGPTRLVRYSSEIDGKLLEHVAISSGRRSIDWPRRVASLVFEPGVSLVDATSGLGERNPCRLLTIDTTQCGLGNQGDILDHMAKLRCLRLHKWQRLEELPAGIESMENLRILEISNCRALQSLPEQIGHLTGLTTLDLNWCWALRSLPEQIGQLTGLTTLDLSSCVALQSLPEQMGRLTGLMMLNLAECGALRSLPEQIGQLTGLTTLDLSRCWALHSLPVGIGRLKGLTMLDPWRCEGLLSLPVQIGQLTGLTTLDLDKCEALKSLPEEFGQLTGLTTLDLSRCWALHSLPVGIGRLTGLTTLDLGGCSKLQSLPEQTGQLTGLTKLDLWRCEGLQSLPVQIGQLTGLITLDLDKCEALKSLPEEFGQLTGLTTLGLSYCRALQSLPEQIGRLTGLTTLDLAWCEGLQSLPKQIGQLSGLTTLDLSRCRALRSLPEQIGQLTGLTALGLRRCGALQSLPEQIGQLTGITALDLSGCDSLPSLPDAIGQLTGLTTLDLWGCLELQSLPEQIGQLTGLTTLNLSGCSALHSLPMQIWQLTGLRTVEYIKCEELRMMLCSAWSDFYFGESDAMSIAKLYENLTGLTTLDSWDSFDSWGWILQSLLEEFGQQTRLRTLDWKHSKEGMRGWNWAADGAHDAGLLRM
jgi:Leucine-rich repeat (LRR) protein